MTDTTADLDDYVRPHLNSSALLVIDMQNDFADDGPYPIAGTAAIVPGLRALIDAYRGAGRPIVHVVRLYDGADVDRVRRTAITRDDAPMVRPGTPGSQILAGLMPPGTPPLETNLLTAGNFQTVGPHETVMWKPRWSAFHRTELDAHLQRAAIDTVVVAGCNFPNCPRATMFDASSLDYRVALASDATSCVTPDRMADARSIGVAPLTVAEIVGALRAD
ncbi:cysteine hydrolase family protein [Prescottella agglutinans]|uniref:Nicotinamidase-related amidase n=1 Tax=Prescottella agglutinans TaxID=1644129 RepID=A0ABT6M6V7_9NOCA|nr:isochorismatase family cysteine hydrolase [Prescottella agglutinans]MDH6280031.1 nicotinamidase-related amidase [Prescottella agglutinans]